jgi:hypothetical protein
MQQFLDASGLNEYHVKTKAIIDASITALQNGDIGLAAAIGTLAQDANIPSSATDALNIIIDDSVLLKLTTSLTNILVGESSNISVTATSKNSASSIIIKNGSEETIASGSGNSLVGSTTVTPGSEGILGFTATAVVNGKTLNAKVYVNCVGKIYYGAGSVYTDASIYASAKPTPGGKYNITVDTDGEYIFFVIPSSMTIAKVSMGGIEIPMETSNTTIDEISYSVYKSKNQYIAGTHQVVVESSFGGGSGGAGININTSDDTMIFGDKQYKLIPVVEE